MIIFDLDGTLADCNHRKKWVMHPRGVKKGVKDRIPEQILEEGQKFVPDWKLFYSLCDLDLPIEPTIELFKLLGEDKEIQIWSGRCESVRHKTEMWLWDHCGCGFDSTLTYPQILKMRPIGDYTPDDQLKERWLDEAIEQGENIEYVFDDRPKVVRMWKRRGIFVFNCYQRDEEF